MSLTHKKAWLQACLLGLASNVSMCACGTPKGKAQREKKEGYSSCKEVLGLLQTLLSWDFFPSFPLCTFPLAVPHAHNDVLFSLVRVCAMVVFTAHPALNSVQLQSQQSMGVPRAKLHSKGAHSQGNPMALPI